MRGLIWGCIYGGGAVVFGAILSHALSGKLTEKELGTLDIAAKYLFYVAMPLLVLHLSKKEWRWPIRLFNMFIISAALFSGSLILLVLTKQSFFAYFTPLGGGLLILSWAYLLFLGIKKHH